MLPIVFFVIGLQIKNEQLNLYPSLQEKVKDENEYKKILSELVEYSLISLGENSINIHPLTQEVVRKSIKTNERDELYRILCEDNP